MTLNYARYLGLLLSLIIATLAHCNTLDWDSTVTQGELPNGLNYYIYNSEVSTDPFNIRLIVHAGSIDEPEVKGIAHAVEHMVFNRTASHPDSIHTYLSHIGWQTGRQVNAVTRPSETHYMVRTRPNDALDINAALSLLVEIAGKAEFEQEDWKREKKIILQEKRLGDRAVSRLNEQIKQATKSDSKYSEGSVIGSYESINNITLADIREFYQRNYIASNMSLIVSGYVNPETVKKQIERSFGALPKVTPPDRKQLHYPLKQQVRLIKVQDPEGSTSKVTLGLRMEIPGRDQPASPESRLEQYFIRKLLAQVRRDAALVPETVDTLTSVLQEPTHKRLTLAFSTRTKHHDDGLKAILTEIERLSRYGFYEDDFNEVLANARETADKNIIAASQRDFARWEDKIVEAVLNSSVVANPESKAKKDHQLLDNITYESVNRRFKKMLSASDIFIYYQAPSSVKLTLPSEDEVLSLRKEISKIQLEKPIVSPKKNVISIKEKSEIKLPLEKPEPSSKIQNKKSFADTSVLEWSLANGYRVVWLQQSTPDNKIYLRAISQTGENLKEYPQWLVNTALQLHEQSPPASVSDDDWEKWNSNNPINWSVKLNPQNLDFSIAVSQEQLESAFYELWIQHQKRKLPPEALTAAKESGYELSKSIPTDNLADLKFGNHSSEVPDKDAIDKLDTDQLETVAQNLVLQPKTLFIVGEAESELLENLSLQYLATLSRSPDLTPKPVLQRNGQHTFTRILEGDMQAQVVQYGRTPKEWFPEQAFIISTLTPIAQQALKKKLRLDMAGVYTLQFENNLNQNTNQVEAELRFESTPEQAKRLLTAANEVLMDLPSVIEKINIVRLREDIYFAETNRLKSPSTWLRRLILSYRKYNDPRYLLTMRDVPELISKELLIKLSKEIFPMPNQVQVITEYSGYTARIEAAE